MQTQTQISEIDQEDKLTSIRAFTKDVPRMDLLQDACDKAYRGSHARQHLVERALDALEKELGIKAN